MAPKICLEQVRPPQPVAGPRLSAIRLERSPKKFPFNPDSHEDATQAEIAAIFGPQGAVTQYAATQASNITLLGRQYIQAPTSTVSINPAFPQLHERSSDHHNEFLPHHAGRLLAE